MARKPTQGPTERELDILQVLWQHGRSNVREVHEQLNESEQLSFTSVQTMLQIMFDKGLVDREMHGRSYIYSPLVSQDETQGTLVSALIDRAFGGSARALVSRALDISRSSPEELKEIMAMIQASQQQTENNDD